MNAQELREQLKAARAEVARLEALEKEIRPDLLSGQVWRHTDGRLRIIYSAKERDCWDGQVATQPIVQLTECLGTLDELVKRPKVETPPPDDSPECIGWWCMIRDASGQEWFPGQLAIALRKLGTGAFKMSDHFVRNHVRPVFRATPEQLERAGIKL